MKKHILDQSKSISFQLLLIIFICLCLGFIYKNLVNITLAIKYCWPATDFWFDAGSLVSPYFLMTLILFLLFIWLAIEFYRQIKSNRLKTLSLSIVISILICLTVFGWTHYKLFQTLQAVNGEKYFYDIWPDAPSLRYSISPSYREMFPSNQEILFKYACVKGLDPHQLSYEQKWKIIRENKPSFQP